MWEDINQTKPHLALLGLEVMGVHPTQLTTPRVKKR
jgi:hypothetical protein